MQNPVGVDQAGEAFSCDLPTPHPASATCDTVTVCQYDNEYMQVCGPDCPEQPVHVAPSRWKELLCDLGPDSCFLGKKTGPCCSAAGYGETPVASPTACYVISLQTLAALRVASALKARTPPLAKSAPGPSGPSVPTIAQAPKAATAQLLSRQAARRHPAPPSPRLASAQMSLVRWITRVVPRTLWWQSTHTHSLLCSVCTHPRHRLSSE